MNWHELFLQMAELVSQKSKDRSTKIGAVIVGPDNEVRSVGFNGFPRRIDDKVDDRHDRPAKYRWTEHAERNAIYNAARVGIPINECRMYTTGRAIACTDCARAIIQSGIVVLYGRTERKEIHRAKGSHWDEDLAIAKAMLDEAGIALIELNANGLLFPTSPGRQLFSVRAGRRFVCRLSKTPPKD